jgi:glycosyltransferase involved in cell wall biosynthesis
LEKISAVIITKEEEENIRRCLDSIRWADEIIVVDAESSDRTTEIAKEFTDKVSVRKWEGFAMQKEYAVSLTSNEWILSLDADEIVSPGLKEEIQKKDLRESDGYLIRRENYLFGKKITSCGWDKDFQLRLFRKSKTEVADKLVHEGFVVTGMTGQLENVIIHNTYSSIHKYLNKVNTYTSLRAEEIYKKKKEKIGALSLFMHTFSAFFRYYISLRGFRDGMEGLIISSVNSISTLLTYVKLWELRRSGE